MTERRCEDCQWAAPITDSGELDSPRNRRRRGPGALYRCPIYEKVQGFHTTCRLFRVFECEEYT